MGGVSVCVFVCREREGERRVSAWLRAMCVCWLRGAARVCVCVGRCVLCLSGAYLLLGGVQRLCEVMVRLIDRAGGGGEAAELEVGVLLGAVVQMRKKSAAIKLLARFKDLPDDSVLIAVHRVDLLPHFSFGGWQDAHFIILAETSKQHAKVLNSLKLVYDLV